MNNQSLKIFAVILAIFFLSGCAIFVRDEDWHHHHRGYWRHSSIQQSNSSLSQMTAQNTGVSKDRGQASR